MQINKPIWRVEGGYCTFCHEEYGHKEDCDLIEWKQEEEDKNEN